MSVIGSNMSLGRTQSLRAPGTATSRSSRTTLTASPTYVSLFLTNLKLLDLDLRHDWPNITTLTFSTKNVQQNQKKRIQCVEWALYHLFAIWDPEETRNKLQPFFPPLEPLQSLNLRAALFRCLDTAKKAGVLGRDTVLRKTMLDECKGERLEEILAVFSNVVLKKVSTERGESNASIARQLAYENLSYHGERDVLSHLILAHKASLSKGVREKAGTRRKVEDFEQLLGLEDRRLARRQEQLKENTRHPSTDSKFSARDAAAIQNEVRSNWAGNENWLEESLFGSRKGSDSALLDTSYHKIWKSVEAGNITELEAQNGTGLIDQLEKRVRDQQSRLERWQTFGRRLQKKGPASPSKRNVTQPLPTSGYKLDFDKHQALHVGSNDVIRAGQALVPKLGEYSSLVDSMKKDLESVGKVRASNHVHASPVMGINRSHSPVPPQELHDVDDDEEEGWSSASEDEVKDVSTSDVELKLKASSPSLDPPAQMVTAHDDVFYQKPILSRSAMNTSSLKASDTFKSTPHRTVSPLPAEHFMPSTEPPTVTPLVNQEAELADEILNSMAAASPSPKKRHTLSLAERTRLSMSRTTHSKFSDLHDEYEVPDLSRLSLKSRPSISVRTPSDEASQDRHADLIERTRKSMAGFEASQKKAQLERRRSVKDEKRKQRQSSYFPKVVEDVSVDESKLEMIEGDPDYDSVFMSRPKIATSPKMSPERIMEEDEDMSP